MKYNILIESWNFVGLDIEKILRMFILIPSVWGGEIGYNVACNLDKVQLSQLSDEGLWPQYLQGRIRKIWVQMKSYLKTQTNQPTKQK